MMKHVISGLLRSAPARAAVSGVLRLSGLAGRLASAARGAVLFPRAVDCFCHWSAEVKYARNITLGRGVIIGPKCTIGAASPITLGDHVHLSKGVFVESGGLDFTVLPPYPHVHLPIVIEAGVWVGANALILAGVTIGAGSIIGAGAVVATDVPPGTIVAGPKVRMWGLD